MAGTRVRASRVPVTEPLAGECDYADAFGAAAPDPDPRTPEEWIRAGFDQAPEIVRRVVRLAQVHVLRLRLAPLDAPGHVLGWRVVTSTPEVARLEARSPLLDGVLVARRVDGHATVLTTALRFTRPAGRIAWLLVGPVHRAIAPRLVARAVRSAQTTGLGR